MYPISGIRTASIPPEFQWLIVVRLSAKDESSRPLPSYSGYVEQPSLVETSWIDGYDFVKFTCIPRERHREQSNHLHSNGAYCATRERLVPYVGQFQEEVERFVPHNLVIGDEPPKTTIYLLSLVFNEQLVRGQD